MRRCVATAQEHVMTKFMPAILAEATLALGSAAFAQTSTAPATTPGATQSKPNATAPSGAPSGKTLSEAEARQELQKQGYGNVGDVKRKGNMYEAHAMKDGKRVSLDVDARTGQVVTR